jgi:hypothetical protein
MPDGLGADADPEDGELPEQFSVQKPAGCGPPRWDVVHRAGGPAGTGGDGRLVGVFD